MIYITLDLQNICDLWGVLSVYVKSADETKLIESHYKPVEELVDMVLPICDKYKVYTIYAWGLRNYLNPIIEKLDPKIEVIV